MKQPPAPIQESLFPVPTPPDEPQAPRMDAGVAVRPDEPPEPVATWEATVELFFSRGR